MVQEGQQQPASAWGFASGLGKRLWDVGCGGTFSGSQLGKAVTDLRLQRPLKHFCVINGTKEVLCWRDKVLEHERSK